MMPKTSPWEFLCEVAFLADFIDDVLASSRGPHWHWPSYYLFYVEADRMAGLLTRIRWLFEPPLADVRGQTWKVQAEGANELFALLRQRQRTLVDQVFQMWRDTRTATGNSTAHARLGAHVHPKSGWYQLFIQAHDPGKLSVDGLLLQRSVLMPEAGSSNETISYGTADYLMQHQSFDLGTPETRQALAHATADAEERIGRSLAAMGALLAEYCTIGDLLHPCSR